MTFDVLPSNQGHQCCPRKTRVKTRGAFKLLKMILCLLQTILTPTTMGPANISQVLPNGPYEGGDYPIETDNQILSASQGDVVGPFTSGQEVLMVKVRETGTREEATAKEHFLFYKRHGE